MRQSSRAHSGREREQAADARPLRVEGGESDSDIPGQKIFGFTPLSPWTGCVNYLEAEEEKLQELT